MALSDLDERGMTEKVPGKGRQLTAAGQQAVETGHGSVRLERIRSHIATLTSQVTDDPALEPDAVSGRRDPPSGTDRS